MKAEVIHINGNVSVSDGLRNIADAIDDGKYDIDDLTLCCGTDIFHLGLIDDEQSAVNAVWNMTNGIHKLMAAVHCGD